MKSKIIFILPSLALIGFLSIKPPAIGSSSGEVIVTPNATITPAAQPNLRDFDDDGNGPDHEDYDDDDDYRAKSNLSSGQQAPITAATPGAIPMPNLGGGDDDDDDDYEDDDDDYDDEDDESDEDDDH